MSFEVNDNGIFIGIDIEGIKKGFEAREKLRERDSQKTQHRAQEVATVEGPAPKLTERVAEKGLLLDIVA